MRLKLSSWALMLLPLFSFQGEKLVKTKVGENVIVYIPKSFVAMSEDDKSTKFLTSRDGMAFFTSEDRLADFTVNKSFSRWRPDDIEMMRSFYRSNILSLFDDVNFIREEVQEIEGNQFAVFEFTSLVKSEEDDLMGKPDLKKYVYIQYTIKDYQTYLFNFTCPLPIRKKWQPVAHDIMQKTIVK